MVVTKLSGASKLFRSGLPPSESFFVNHVGGTIVWEKRNIKTLSLSLTSRKCN